MSRVRRRAVLEVTEYARWQRDRRWLIAQQVRGGYGVRPREWWLYESGRPDLAPDDTAADIYCHLGTDEDLTATPAAERLRFLADSGELTAREHREIAERAEKQNAQVPTFQYPPRRPGPDSEQRAFIYPPVITSKRPTHRRLD